MALSRMKLRNLVTNLLTMPVRCEQPADAAAGAGSSVDKQPQQQLAGTKRPAASLQAAGPQGAAAPGAAAGADAAAVPKGFFDDKVADNLARGIKA